MRRRLAILACAALLCVAAAPSAAGASRGPEGASEGVAAAAKRSAARSCRRGSRRTRAACRRRAACQRRARRRYARRPSARRRALARCRRPAKRRKRPPVPAPLTASPAPSRPPAVVPPRVTPPPPPPLGRRLQVQAREFYFSLSRPEVASGDVTVELLNRGEDPHDLMLRSPEGNEELGLAETPSLGMTSGVFPLAAGDWTLFCSLEGHEVMGMKATLHVR